MNATFAITQRYNGIGTRVKGGSQVHKCEAGSLADSTSMHCAGSSTIGTGGKQAAAVVKAITNAGIYPGKESHGEYTHRHYHTATRLSAVFLLPLKHTPTTTSTSTFLVS